MALPIDPLLPDIVASLAERNALVLVAPPGAGKTTRVPLALADAPWAKYGRILVLEPRRLAAKLAARHMAAGLGEAVGGRVGYRVRLDSKVGPKTQVELLTDGLFLRRLQSDPGLEGVACVVFDEFHERGLESDLALALSVEAQTLNPALRLLVMSATLAAEPVARLLGGAPVLRSEGRSFPVEIRWAAPATPRERMEETVAATVRRALAEAAGSLLVFLPGAREIRRTAALLEVLPEGVEVARLAGELAGPEQEAALAPAPPGRRKVVLATAIAETSLTIEGIRIVIDSGWARLPRFDPRSAMTRLETLPASQATATQRTGRAGRLQPGLCYRLWSEAEHRARPPFASPEILAADLAPLALELALWGGGEALAFLDPPPPGPLAQARELLTTLAALDHDGRITAPGRAMAALGLHPRLAHMLLRAKQWGQGGLACGVAALLEARDPLRGQRDSDLAHRLELLFGRARDPRVDRGALQEARRLMRQWQRQLGVGPPQSLAEAGAVLALAYPDRLAQQSGAPGHFRLANGRRAFLPPEDPLAGEPFLAVASLDGAAERARIFLALPIARSQIEARFAEAIAERSRVAWDAQTEAVTAQSERRLGALRLESRPLRDVVGTAAVAEGIRRLGHAALPWTDAARQLQARVAFLRALAPADWPDLSDATLLDDPAAWLGSQLEGVTRRAQFARLDLARALRERLDGRRRGELDRLAPERLPVPSGREAAIGYGSGAPVLAVKLQELFGLLETPRVAGGRVPVTLELLSPAGRPVQVTQDLAGFWRNGYAAVRAELRGRYPRHPWPEDPLSAPPQRSTKRRGR